MAHRSRRLANTTCGWQCNKVINEKEDESMQCDKCQHWYHQKCTDIPKCAKIHPRHGAQLVARIFKNFWSTSEFQNAPVAFLGGFFRK